MKFNSFARRSATEANEPRRITSRMITPKTPSIRFGHERGFGGYTNRIRWLDSDKDACRLATDLSTPRLPSLPRSVETSHDSATSLTRLAEPWMFELSTTNAHEPSGSVATVCSMWPAKSAPVRVGPIVGRSNPP